MSTLDRILPFLKPIEDLLRDPAVTEVMVNERERALWQAISRGLKLIVSAIDQYIGKDQPTSPNR